MRARLVLYAGDIITAVSGSATGTARHKTAIVSPEYEGAIATTGFTKLAIRKDDEGKPLFLPYYLVALLKSNLVLADIKRRTRGATIPSINETDLLEVKIPLPLDIRKQEDIGDKMRGLLEASKSKISQLENAYSTYLMDIESLIVS